MKYNHDRPLSDFQEELTIIRNAGFNPIGVSQLYFEDTFIFETEEESKRAYRRLERDSEGRFLGDVVGWWHGEKDFKDAVRKYESENDGYSKVRTYWFK